MVPQTLREIYAVDKTQESFGYNLNRFALDLAMMALLGTLYRIVSYVLLVNMHRDKQR